MISSAASGITVCPARRKASIRVVFPECGGPVSTTKRVKERDVYLFSCRLVTIKWSVRNRRRSDWDAERAGGGAHATAAAGR